MSEPMRVLFLAAEADPFVKVGGLGDVAGSLPQALRSLSTPIDIRLALPYFDFLDLEGYDPRPAASFTIREEGREIMAEGYRMTKGGLPVYLISGEPLARAEGVYSDDSARDGRKFSFFSLAAMEMARSRKWQPDILHAHDWHTSPAVYNLDIIRGDDPFYRNTRSLLTVHNLPYLGHGTEKALMDFGLPPAEDSPLPPWAQGLPLPLGLLAADGINTVSQGYAQEILTAEFGAGLESFLQTRASDLHGILNGLDVDSWDPRHDEQLSRTFGIDDLARRAENKASLLSTLRLEPDPELPLIGMINRMDYQKGVDLVPDALRALMDQPWQAVILGTGDPEIEEQARQLEEDLPRVRSVLRYDTGLARRIYGGADMLLIPSRYEPCGLTQMIAMRYGCVPVARATGGLQDTIGDYARGQRSQSTGFLFPDATSKSLEGAIRRALAAYDDKRRWRGLQRRGMKRDFSWERSAKEYAALYQKLLQG